MNGSTYAILLAAALLVVQAVASTPAYVATITNLALYDANGVPIGGAIAGCECLNCDNSGTGSGGSGSIVGPTVSILDDYGRAYLSAVVVASIPLAAGQVDITFGFDVWGDIIGNSYDSTPSPIFGPVAFVLMESPYLSNGQRINFRNGFDKITTDLPMVAGSSQYQGYFRVPAASANRIFYVVPIWRNDAGGQASLAATIGYHVKFQKVGSAPGPSSGCATDPNPPFVAPTTAPPNNPLPVAPTYDVCDGTITRKAYVAQLTRISDAVDYTRCGCAVYSAISGCGSSVNPGNGPIRINYGQASYYAPPVNAYVTIEPGVEGVTFGIELRDINNINARTAAPVGFILANDFLCQFSVYDNLVLYHGLDIVGAPSFSQAASFGYEGYFRVEAADHLRTLSVYPVYTDVASLGTWANPDFRIYYSMIPGTSSYCSTDPNPVSGGTTAPPPPSPTTVAPTTLPPPPPPITTVAPTTLPPSPPPTTTVCAPQQCSLATCGQVIPTGCGDSLQCQACPVGQCSVSGQRLSCTALSSGQALVTNTSGDTSVSILFISFSIHGGSTPSLSINMLYTVNGGHRVLLDDISLTNAKYVTALQMLLSGASDSISFTFPIAVSGLNMTVLVDLTLDNVVLSTDAKKKRQESLVDSADVLLGLCFVSLPGKSGLAHGNNSNNNQHGLNNRVINAQCESRVTVAYSAEINNIGSAAVDALLRSLGISSSSSFAPLALVVFSTLAWLF